MNLPELHITVFNRIMHPSSARSRRKRMRDYVSLMGIKKGMSVLDLGGDPMIWDNVEPSLNITILNLSGVAMSTTSSHHTIQYVTGDACRVEGFEDGIFDCVFSNSVIEHVGPVDKQSDFAREVRRLGKSYWVQTPSEWFPIEAHCGMPFWWFYPSKLRAYFIQCWAKRIPSWAKMIEETRVLTRADLRRLFPEATIRVERFYGIPKSYIAYFPGSSNTGRNQSD